MKAHRPGAGRSEGAGFRGGPAMAGAASTATPPDPARRHWLQAALAVGAMGLTGWPGREALAAHGMAWGGEPRYPDRFDHFDYVRPDAPRGGMVRLAGWGTFDSLNPYALRGLAAQGLPVLMFESLGVASWDEPFSIYGLLAEDMILAEDRRSVMFKLRAEARFNDGSPVLAEDVRHSFEAITGPKGHPMYRQYFGEVERVEVMDERLLRFFFRRINPELHLILAKDLPIFSRRWGDGRTLDVIAHEAPITSGPYVIDDLDLGKRIGFRRVENYWADDLPVRRGMFNFSRVIFKYFRDGTARLEGFKAGEFDWTFENSARNWARGHVGSRYRSGELVRRSFPNSMVSGMQGFALNTRRPRFQDVRVREALALAFDFDWLNRQVFYGQYTRTRSYFANSAMAATGAPDADESRFLQSLHTPPGPAVFEAVPELPDTPDALALRNNLRRAQQLLEAAGWKVGADGQLRNDRGEAFRFEVLGDSPATERVASPWVHNLGRLGIGVKLRTVDPALYQKRLRDFDFDVTTTIYPMSSTPGNELWQMLGSAGAQEKGSANYAGIADPVVDEIIGRILAVRSREELDVAARVLDRVLRHGWYMVPQFYSSSYRVAFDYRLRYPTVLPLFYEPTSWMLQTWWFDAGARPQPPDDTPHAVEAPEGVSGYMPPTALSGHAALTASTGRGRGAAAGAPRHAGQPARAASSVRAQGNLTPDTGPARIRSSWGSEAC